LKAPNRLHGGDASPLAHPDPSGGKGRKTGDIAHSNEGGPSAAFRLGPRRIPDVFGSDPAEADVSPPALLFGTAKR
jgi:hypothetical protein